MSLFAQRIRQANAELKTGDVDAKTGLPKTFAVSHPTTSASQQSSLLSAPQQPPKKQPSIKMPKSEPQMDSLRKEKPRVVFDPEPTMIESKSTPAEETSVKKEPDNQTSEDAKILDVLSEKDIDYIDAQNSQMLAKMDPKELEMQKQMLMGLLSKQNIDFLMKNKGYLESRKNEIKVSKHDKTKEAKPEDFLKPKTKSAKQVFMEKHAATQSIKGMIPGLAPEMFEDDNFELFYYGCYFDNNGHHAFDLTKEELEESSNAFDIAKSDEYHTWSDLVDLMDSTHPGHVVFALEKIGFVLKQLAISDADFVDAVVAGTKKCVRLSKMRTILGLIEVAWLDKRVVYQASKKNINIQNAALKVSRWLLRWLTNRSIMIGRKAPEVVAQVIKLVMGDSKEENQIDIAFLDASFSALILQQVSSQDNIDLLCLLFEVHFYLRFLAPNQKGVCEITKKLIDRMKEDPSLGEKLSIVEKNLEATSACPIQNSIDLSDPRFIFEQITLYRSNLKHGAKLNSLSIKLLSDAFSLLPRESVQVEETETIIKGLFDLHTFASLSILYGTPGVVHQYLSLLPVFHSAGEWLSKAVEKASPALQKRQCLHIVDSRHYEAVYASTLECKADLHFDQALKINQKLDSEVVFEGEGENRVMRIRPTLLTLELYTESLPDILCNVYPTLTEAEKMMVFADLVKFYSKDDTGAILSTKELLNVVLSGLDKSFLKEAIGQLSSNEAFVKALMDNYKYCSYGDPGFTTLLFLFTSKYGKFDIAKYAALTSGKSTRKWSRITQRLSRKACKRSCYLYRITFGRQQLTETTTDQSGVPSASVSTLIHCSLRCSLLS